MKIIVFSVIVWWVIDQIKRAYPAFGIPADWQKLVTIVMAIGMGAACAWGYQLDLLMELTITDAMSFGGQAFAAVAIAAGSSAVYELIEKIKGPGKMKFAEVTIEDLADLIGHEFEAEPEDGESDA